MNRFYTIFILVLLSFSATADAVYQTEAAIAGTIAEFYVVDEGVRVELEIGGIDLPAFRNLLPDPAWERAGLPIDTPFNDRLKVFFEQNFSMLDALGSPLSGSVVLYEPGDRLQRDVITGEVLASADAERVLRVRLWYPFAERPDALTIRSQFERPAPAIGFVVYHKGVAVNDFRYLQYSQSLTLDWEDPWYTAFDARSLRRNYFAPMSGYIYVEPFEVRKEIIVRPKDIQRWIDIGLAGATTIPVDAQPEIKNRIAEFLRQRQPVTIDGRVVEPELARVNFLSRSLRSSTVIDPPEEMDVDVAVLGVIFVYRLDTPLPEQVEMTWDMFDDKVQLVPVSAVDEAGPLPQYLQPDDRVLRWTNFLKNPTLPEVVPLPKPPAKLALVLQASFIWFFAAVGIALLVLAIRRDRHSLVAALLVCVVVAGVWGVSRMAAMTHEQERELVGQLLRNVYRSFDFRKEAEVYDALDQSVAGELLSRVYLETRGSLILANQGGASAKVKEIELLELDITDQAPESFIANAAWRVDASVGHWGHVHTRQNQYRANLTIGIRDGVWKLLDTEILEETRL